MRPIILAALLLCGCVSPAAAPSPSPSPIPTPSASPSPTASPSPSTIPTAGVYTNFVLGYRIDTPAPWRRSACLSTQDQTQLPAGDGFVQVAESDEVGTDIGYTFRVVRVSVEPNPDRLAPDKWVAAGNIGSTQGQTVESATLDGRAALRVRPTAFGPLAYVLGVADRMFVIGYQLPYNDQSDDPAIRQMVE